MLRKKGKVLADGVTELTGKLLHHKDKTKVVDVENEDNVVHEVKVDGNDASSSSWGHETLGPVENRELAMCANLIKIMEKNACNQNHNINNNRPLVNSEVTQSAPVTSTETKSVIHSKPLPIPPQKKHHAISIELQNDNSAINKKTALLATQRQRIKAEANKRNAIYVASKNETKTEVQELPPVILEDRHSSAKSTEEQNNNTEILVEGNVSLENAIDTIDVNEVKLNVAGTSKSKSSWASFFCCCCKSESGEDETSRLIVGRNPSIQSV